ncbi:hypothetical protein Pmani_029552 [Petrolisthes manimaculis]|uniref:Uncharacterized protein n=1 Tax=Petrolisthes manimaculis TaxID=1843537 RepID=A0AAE1NXS6_9EUCA|nr:hypothetical protein Pmani_029552 [Petrolisthes manimaculis]
MFMTSNFFLPTARADKGYDCGYKTVWLEKTEYRPVPYYHGGKSVANPYEPVYLTTTVLNKQSVPYFITQTQNVPQFVTKKATLPQYITHTVINTHPKYVTVTEKSYVTVYATRTRKTYETVCPKGYGGDHGGGGHGGGYGHGGGGGGGHGGGGGYGHH